MAWSSDGRLFYVSVHSGGSAITAEETLAIPVPPGKSMPDLPAAGIDLTAGVRGLPGARVIEHGAVSPGSDASTYFFTRTDLQRNLFRYHSH